MDPVLSAALAGIAVGAYLLLEHLLSFGRLLDLDKIPGCHGFIGAVIALLSLMARLQKGFLY